MRSKGKNRPKGHDDYDGTKNLDISMQNVAVRKTTLLYTFFRRNVVLSILNP